MLFQPGCLLILPQSILTNELQFWNSLVMDEASSSLSESAFPRNSSSDGDAPRHILTTAALPSAQFEPGTCTEVPAMVLIFFAVRTADLCQCTKIGSYTSFIGAIHGLVGRCSFAAIIICAIIPIAVRAYVYWFASQRVANTCALIQYTVTECSDSTGRTWLGSSWLDFVYYAITIFANIFTLIVLNFIVLSCIVEVIQISLAWRCIWHWWLLFITFFAVATFETFSKYHWVDGPISKSLCVATIPTLHVISVLSWAAS